MADPLLAFDLDGTLIDSRPGIIAAAAEAWVMVAPERGAMPVLQIGPPLKLMLATALGNSEPLLVERWAAAFRCCYDGGLWRSCGMYPGIQSTLSTIDELPAFKAVVTNKPHAAAERILGHLGLIHYFDLVASLDSPEGPFPAKSHVLAWTIRRAGSGPNNALYVGDDSADRRAAGDCGAAFLPVSWGYGDAATSLSEHDFPTAFDGSTLLAGIRGFIRGSSSRSVV